MRIQNIFWFLLIAVLFVLFAMCSKPSEPEFDNPYDEQGDAFVSHPELITLEVESVRALEAWSGGEFTNDYGHPVTAKGVCWSTDENPTIDDTCTNDGQGMEAFESHLNDLEPDQQYYVRAYATNSNGTIYGSQNILITLDGIPKIHRFSISELGINTVIVVGEIEENGLEIVEINICYWIENNSTDEKQCITLDKKLLNFEIIIDDLKPESEYVIIMQASTILNSEVSGKKEFTTEGLLPTVITGSASNISANSAQIHAEVADSGTSEVYSRGVCWDTNPNPNINSTCSNDGHGAGNFSTLIKNLTENTAYYVKAFARNNMGIAYGNEIQFKSDIPEFRSCGDLIKDIDGNVYKTVLIGRQCWTAENLKTTRYRDGSDIYYATDSNKSTRGAFAFYDHDSDYSEIYGNLYNWYATYDNRGLCPSGWKVPSDSDWYELEKGLGMSTSHKLDEFNGVDQNVGGKLKSDSDIWNSPNIGATNESGFSALPGGVLWSRFSGLGSYGAWWTSDYFEDGWGLERQLHSGSSGVYFTDLPKYRYLSVRCIN